MVTEPVLIVPVNGRRSRMEIKDEVIKNLAHEIGECFSELERIREVEKRQEIWTTINGWIKWMKPKGARNGRRSLQNL